MKFLVVVAAALAVASAQFRGFSQPPPRFQTALPTPLPTRFPVPSPLPFVPSPLPPRPSAAPLVNRVAANDAAASIIRYDNDVGPDGSFAYAFETDNGIAAEAQGTPRNLGGNPPVVPVVIQGRYSHVTPEGQQVIISYIADENGYQPQGDAIPTSPPIPEAILRSLEYIARNPPAPQKK